MDANGNERQYAVAINVPTDQCQYRLQQNNFLTSEDAETVKTAMVNAQYPVYRGEELIAAGTIRRRYTIHSERLLLNPTPEEPVTPMQNLLNRRTDDSCTVFYTFNSPCTTVCLDENNKYNILKSLEGWSGHSGIKAFVFKKFWDKESSTREILEERFRKIINYVPLYRCDNDGCHACGGQNNAPINERCFPNTQNS